MNLKVGEGEEDWSSEEKEKNNTDEFLRGYVRGHNIFDDRFNVHDSFSFDN